MKRFELATRNHTSADFNMKCIKHNGLSGVGKSYKEVEVLGRDFPLIVDNHTRDRFKLKVEVIVDSDSIEADARRIKKWLLNDIEDLPIQLSDMPDQYFMGFLDNKLDIEDVIAQVGAVTLNFNCRPYALIRGGDNYVEMTNGSKLINTYGLETRPLIRVKGTGNVKFSIGGQEVDLRDIAGTVYIDCEIMDTYIILPNGNYQLQNNKMYSDFPVLKLGENEFSILEGAVTEVAIMPRWKVL